MEIGLFPNLSGILRFIFHTVKSTFSLTESKILKKKQYFSVYPLASENVVYCAAVHWLLYPYILNPPKMIIKFPLCQQK
jgi:hypothetical protein